jgi:hypothetical protein
MLLLHFREWNHTLYWISHNCGRSGRSIFPAKKSLNIKKGYILRETQLPTLFVSSSVSVGIYRTACLLWYQANDWVFLCFHSYENIRLICTGKCMDDSKDGTWIFHYMSFLMSLPLIYLVCQIQLEDFQLSGSKSKLSEIPPPPSLTLFANRNFTFAMKRQ